MFGDNATSCSIKEIVSYGASRMTDAQRISPFDDDFGILADEVVLAEDEERSVWHPLQPQPSNKPFPASVSRHCRHVDPSRGLTSTGEGRPRAGGVDPSLADPGSRDRRRPDNNIHRRPTRYQSQSVAADPPRLRRHTQITPTPLPQQRRRQSLRSPTNRRYTHARFA